MNYDELAGLRRSAAALQRPRRDPLHQRRRHRRRRDLAGHDRRARLRRRLGRLRRPAPGRARDRRSRPTGHCVRGLRRRPRARGRASTGTARAPATTAIRLRRRRPEPLRRTTWTTATAALGDPDARSSRSTTACDLQFQSLSVNPKNPGSELLGGTQDNGTWSFTARRWFESVGGDGGSPASTPRPDVRYHNYYDATPEVNFHGNDPKTWLASTTRCRPRRGALVLRPVRRRSGTRRSRCSPA